VSGGCGRGPCRRAVDRAAVRSNRDYLWELTFRRKIAWDVRIVGSVIADVGKALVRIKHEYLLAKLLANQVKWCDEVRIATNEGHGVNAVRKRIIKHVGRDVDIRPFLFESDDMYSAIGGLLASSACAADRRHPDLVFVVITFDDFESLDFGERTQIDSLAFNSFGVVRICSDTCGVELDNSNHMVASYQCPRERQRIKPFRATVIAEKPVVKIPRVDIDIRFHICKMLRPRPFRIGASPRIGRASRSDVNLLRGSGQLYQIVLSETRGQIVNS